MLEPGQQHTWYLLRQRRGALASWTSMDLARVRERPQIICQHYKGQDLGNISHTIISLFSNCAFKARVEKSATQGGQLRI